MHITKNVGDQYSVKISGEELALIMLLINEAPTCFTDCEWERVGDDAHVRLEALGDQILEALPEPQKV